jgi:hypothetical protein
MSMSMFSERKWKPGALDEAISYENIDSCPHVVYRWSTVSSQRIHGLTKDKYVGVGKSTCRRNPCGTVGIPRKLVRCVPLPGPQLSGLFYLNKIFSGTQPRQLVAGRNQLTRLCAREDFIEFSRRESFKLYILFYLTTLWTQRFNSSFSMHL